MHKRKAKSIRGTQICVTSACFRHTAVQRDHIRDAETEPVRGDNDDDDYVDDGNLEEYANRFVRENVGSLASLYLMPYACKRRFLDTQYGIRNDGDIFKIGDTDVVLNTEYDITIKEKEFRGPEGVWELLTRKKVNN